MLLTSLHDAAIRDSDTSAVTIGGETLSREALLGAATAAAARVQGARVVAVLAEPSARTIVAVTGALLAGIPVVPVPPDAGPAEVAHILRDSRAQVWLGPVPAVAEAPDVPQLPAIPVRVHARDWHRLPEPSADTPAFIMYTSGTTGPPKGAVLSRRAIETGLDALAEAWQWTPDDRLVHGLPLFHVHGLVLGVLGALRVGSPLVHTGRPSPGAYAAAGGTLYFGVPTVWSRVAGDASAARALSAARLLVSGSAALPVPVFEQLASLTGHRLVERYGMTETLITVSARADEERRAGWVGLPVRGAETRIVSEAGAVPHDGESIGQLQVRGPMLFSGYAGRPEATAVCFTDDGWFRTGDIAAIDGAGSHRIVGRESTDLIKSGGYRIGAGEVEAALLAHPGIQEAAVVGVPDADLGQRIVAYVVGELDNEGAAIDFVAEYLSAHKRPREVRFVEALPRNAMGKVQKTKLLDG